jgi:N-acetylmuramoyl-L-alanine amidase
MKLIQHFNDTEIFARTLFGEARGEVENPFCGEDGLVAVANVIMNRCKQQTWFGKTPRQICLKPYQFSCWNQNDVNFRIITKNNINHEVYKKCLKTAESSMDGTLNDITKGADHYHSVLMRHRPRWTEGHLPVCQIGNHVFYKIGG